MKCSNCGTENAEAFKFCEKCGKPLSKPPASPTLPLSLEEKQKLIRHSIFEYIKLGYHLVFATDTTAQLIRPKTINGGFAALYLLIMPLIGALLTLSAFFLIGVLIIALGSFLFFLQMAFYFSRRDEAVYVYFSTEGKAESFYRQA